MSKQIDIRPVAATLHFIPVETRTPLKFGPETTTSVTCARVAVEVEDRRGRRARGWGETPLSVQWAWPSSQSYERRHRIMKDFCRRLVRAWADFTLAGHPLEVGHDFQADVLLSLWNDARKGRDPQDQMPWLAALVCCSPFDIALHDAYGLLLERPTYDTYTSAFLNRDLSAFITPADDTKVTYKDRYPDAYLRIPGKRRLLAWHLVGGLDLLSEAERTGDEPDDDYPVVLPDWIRRDGLRCLKVKLKGTDAAWDYQRLADVGRIALDQRVDWLSSDFNCTVTEPEYVNDILDRLERDHPDIFNMILYVEQPFPYDLESGQIDVSSVARRKPLFMDESAHDWRLIRLGRRLGWTGVALKTCKTQTEAILSGCWARSHNMDLMVQDLTNPMLAIIPHVQLAAHVGTIAGVETNAMQFYPDASRPEEAVHPGLYRRRDGHVDLSTLGKVGFGYRLDEITRTLPKPE